MGTLSRVIKAFVASHTPRPVVVNAKPFTYDDMTFDVKVTDVAVYDEYMAETNRLIEYYRTRRAHARHCSGKCCQ